MAKNKSVIKTLIILSLCTAFAGGIYSYRNSIQDKQLSKVYFGCAAPIRDQPYWPNSTQAVSEHLTNLKEQDKNLTEKIDLMLKEAKKTASESKNKLGYYRARDLEQLKQNRSQLRTKIAITELMGKGKFTSLELFANKHNLYFKNEMLKRFSKHASEISDIIKAVEATDIYTDKRILALKFYNRTTAQAQTGVQNSKSGAGEVLTLRRKKGTWVVISKKSWTTK